MNPKIKEEWIAALRSGEYIQGQSALKQKFIDEETKETKFKYCCLGVLCELAAKEDIVKAYDPSVSYPSMGFVDPVQPYTKETSYLPQAVQTWAGLYSRTASYGPPNVGRSLAQDNDTGKTFEEIANIIEKHF